jgi:membrane associated rhomboid family serine protease
VDRSADFIYDPDAAWNYYQRFVQAERSLRQRRHHQGAFEFFGSVDAVEPNANATTGEVGRRGSVRRDRLGSASEPPVELRRRKKRKKNTKLQRQSTLVQHKVESLPSFTPWFIIVMSILQVIALVVLISINEGVAPIRAAPIRHSGVFPSLRSNNSNATERVTYYEAVNLWIGLPPRELIRIGAKFTPCMRRDFDIRDRNSEIYGENSDTLGCCKNRENVGTTLTTSDCACFSGNVNCTLGQENVTEIAYNFGSCTDNFETTNIGLPSFHPCCVSITGRCLVTSSQECDARGGQYHPTADSCLDVNCLEGVCGFNGANVGFDSGTPYLPNANQFWRFILSIFIHLGVLHIIVIMPVQLYIGFKIERTIGWLRTGLIYLIAGVGGNIVSGIFVPYGVNAGASGAVFGLIGVLFVELFQFWQIVDRAFLELLKLFGFAVFLLAIGTLPFIDNMAHIGGLLFGVVAAVIFVPYITFGKLDAARKRILLAICIPLLFLLFLASLLTFYLIPNPSFCPECSYINCIPYTRDLCPEEYRDASTEIYSL